MAGAIAGYTAKFKFAKVRFDTTGWQAIEHSNWEIIDALFALISAIPGLRGAWTNSILYTVGDRAVDALDGGVYRCLVTHSSPTSGTFLESRAANPTYWIAVTSVPEFRGPWATGINYNNADIVVVNSYSYYYCTSAHTSSATFAADAPTKWTLVFDATASVSATSISAANAASSASAASTSAGNAAASATSASGSAGSSATSAANSASSATTASTHAGNASVSAGSASASASDAAISAASAFTSAGSAATSASTAATHASNAGTSASNAAGSAANAATSAANAAGAVSSRVARTGDVMSGSLAIQTANGYVRALNRLNGQDADIFIQAANDYTLMQSSMRGAVRAQVITNQTYPFAINAFNASGTFVGTQYYGDYLGNFTAGTSLNAPAIYQSGSPVISTANLSAYVGTAYATAVSYASGAAYALAYAVSGTVYVNGTDAIYAAVQNPFPGTWRLICPFPSVSYSDPSTWGLWMRIA